MRRLGLVPLLLCGCTPELGAPLSRITTERVLAVRGTPAEAAPGTVVAWDALVASPDGTMTPPLLWSWCLVPRPYASASIVDEACLAPEGGVPLGAAAPAVSAMLPSAGCQLFGSDRPPPTEAVTEPRPRSPDATGGYYQPLRVDLGSATTIALARIACNLRGASLPIAEEFRARYTANRHPRLASLDAPIAVAPGRTVDLRAAWTSEDAERFVVFDVLSQTLVEQRESLRVSWFASAGELAVEHSGRASDDSATDAVNQWTAPPELGVVHVWVVLRDNRGGVDWGALELIVRRDAAP